MAIIFRTDDGTRWGFGKGSNLTNVEVDLNFWQVLARVIELEDNPPTAISIAYFETIGSQFNVHMTDHSVLGPYDLPIAQWNDRGNWQPSTVYVKQDIFRNGGALYLVIFNHTSGLTFDPDANDGMGHDFYSLLLSGPSTTVKTVTDHTYGFIASDAFSYIRATNAGGCIFMISADSILTFSTGTEITLHDVSDSGSMTVVALSGVQLNVPAGFLAQSFSKHATMTLKKVDVDEWDLIGLLATA